MRRSHSRIAAAITAVAAGGAAVYALRPADKPVVTLAARSPAVEYRTQVIRRTVHVIRHESAAHFPTPRGVVATGGTGKGLCADAVAHRLGGYTRFVVDCGGDIAVGGVGPQLEPYEIDVEHPLTGEVIGRIKLDRGGVATSGVNVRIWQRPDGAYAHHLLDPSTGRPAWTGLIGVTAIAGSALEAETLSKLALLVGPDAARRVLADRGGVIVQDSGEVELVGSLVCRMTAPARLLVAS